MDKLRKEILSMSKALACPFCNGEVTFHCVGEKWIDIDCRTCPANMRGNVDHIDEIVALWNKRYGK